MSVGLPCHVIPREKGTGKGLEGGESVTHHASELEKKHCRENQMCT